MRDNNEVTVMNDQDVLCGCNNITLKDVKLQIARGVKTFEELQENISIGIYCPPCYESSKKVFEDLLKSKNSR